MTLSLHHGDARSILASLPDASVDAVITDPPYSVDVYDRMHGAVELRRTGQGRPRGVGMLAKMAAGDIGAVNELAPDMAREIARLTKRWALVFSDLEFAHEWRRLLTAAGMRYVRTGAWIKPDPLPQMTGDRPGVGFEPCTICHGSGRLRWNGGGKAAMWLYGIAKGDARPNHPCPKPLALMVELVRLFTDPGETVLDPFMGSGTTGVACLMLGRRFIGCEINAEYFAVARERFARAEQDERTLLIPRRGKQGRML
jgi:site-specific DNA-methyltransferase (adenine-specific)